MKMNQTDESSFFAEAFIRTWRNKGFKVEVVLLTLIVLSCAAAPMITPYGVNEVNLAGMFGTPSLKRIFGTDAIGCDLFSRLLYGGRYFLALGICAAVSSVVLGYPIGRIAGYFSGRMEALIMRFLDIWSSLPSMLLCILISAVLGAGFFHTILTLATRNVPTGVRLIRGQVPLKRSKDYLEAAQSINYSHLSIMFRHILPSMVFLVIVDAIMNIGMNVTIAAALSYIDLGVQPSTPGWSAMLTDARTHILSYPHLIMFPGIVITPTVSVINLIGDGLCDAVNPKLRS